MKMLRATLWFINRETLERFRFELPVSSIYEFRQFLTGISLDFSEFGYFVRVTNEQRELVSIYMSLLPLSVQP
jgi:hypothetical protein